MDWKLFPHSGLPLVLGPLGRYWGGFFCSCPCVCVSVCLSETSSPSCFANFASFDTNFGRHNRHSPKMLNTEWPWVWPQRSRSASVSVSLRTLHEGELRQFCVYWTKFFYTATLKLPERDGQLFFPKITDIDRKVKVTRRPVGFLNCRVWDKYFDPILFYTSTLKTQE